MLLSNDYAVPKLAGDDAKAVRCGYTIHRPGFPGFEGAVGQSDNDYNVWLYKQVSLDELAAIVELLKTHRVSRVTMEQMK